MKSTYPKSIPTTIVELTVANLSTKQHVSSLSRYEGFNEEQGTFLRKEPILYKSLHPKNEFFSSSSLSSKQVLQCKVELKKSNMMRLVLALCFFLYFGSCNRVSPDV